MELFRRSESIALCAIFLTLAVSATCIAASPARPGGAPSGNAREAKKVFGAIKAAPDLPAQVFGGYALGCVAGAKQLALEGPAWQVMRLSRNRMWGHPVLLKYIEKFAADAQRLDGWAGLLVGDMGQPLGGPMLSGHASHQIGLDVDLWFKPMPSHVMTAAEREELSADSMVDEAAVTVDKAQWTEGQLKLLRRAASYPEVARIFVHPAIKKALCDAAGSDRGWLTKIRPWWKHNDHFHVRLNCPSGSPACVAQPPNPAGDGCGKELEDWLKRVKAPPVVKKEGKPAKPSKPLLLSQMPKECQNLAAVAERSASANAAQPPSPAAR